MSRTGLAYWPESSCMNHLCRPCRFQKHVRKPYIHCLAACRLPCRTRMPCKSSHFRSARDEDVPMFRDVFTGCKTLNKVTVKFPARRIVDVGYVSFRLVKPGAFDKTLQAVVLRLLYSISTRVQKSPRTEHSSSSGHHLGDKGI